MRTFTCSPAYLRKWKAALSAQGHFEGKAFSGSRLTGFLSIVMLFVLKRVFIPDVSVSVHITHP